MDGRQSRRGPSAGGTETSQQDKTTNDSSVLYIKELDRTTLTEIQTIAFYSTAQLLDEVEKLKGRLNALVGKTKHYFRLQEDQVALKKMA